MITTVLFDIDGVLLDSFEANHDFLNRILVAAGYQKMSFEKYKNYTHLPLLSVAKMHSAANDDGLNRIRELANIFPRSSHLLKTPKNAYETLITLSNKYKLGIVTSRVERGVDAYFTFAGTKELFSTVVHYNDVLNPKPHPEPLLLALKRLGTNASETVYVGDAASDIQAARAANMSVIQYTEFTFDVKQADASTNKFSEIPKIIEQLDCTYTDSDLQ